MIRLALRFDDASAISHRGVESGIIDALKDTGIQATFAVIPYSDTPSGRLALDSQCGAHLLAACQSGLVEIALHGYSHRRVSTDGRPSEFCGLPVERQAAILTEAMEHLSGMFGGRSISGFVPPWNSYDAATVAALEGLGFDYISADRRHYPPGYAGPLAVLPFTCQFNALELAIAEARRYSRFAPHVVAVLHHFDFHESGAVGSRLDLQEFADSLAWLKRQPDVQVMTLREMATVSLAGAPARTSKRRLRKVHLPWRLQQRLPKLCLVDAPIWRLLLASMNPMPIGR